MWRCRLVWLLALAIACGCGRHPAPSPIHAVDASAGAGQAGSAEWLTDFQVAQRQARERNVPIVANFTGSDWCPWCIKLEREVLSKPEFQEFALRNVVLFVADFPSRKMQDSEVTAQNQALQQRYGVEGLPTVLVLDPSGKEIARTGYQSGGAAAYVDHLRRLISGKSS